MPLQVSKFSSLCGSGPNCSIFPCKIDIKTTFLPIHIHTANDWTLYPFCTQNEKDYYNLMSVYLDCVFHPLLKEMDFRFGHTYVYIKNEKLQKRAE